MDKEERVDVSIPASLYKKIEEKIKGTETDSVSSYVTKIIKENLAKEEGASESLSKEDEEKVKERLKALGYLD
jgi:metal-responsive CopG/Arc/MetJ family transcriptional regulator